MRYLKLFLLVHFFCLVSMGSIFRSRQDLTWSHNPGTWQFICPSLGLKFDVEMRHFGAPPNYPNGWESDIAATFVDPKTLKQVVRPFHHSPRAGLEYLTGELNVGAKGGMFELERLYSSPELNFTGSLKLEDEPTQYPSQLLYVNSTSSLVVSNVDVEVTVPTKFNSKPTPYGQQMRTDTAQKSWKVTHPPSGEFLIETIYYQLVDLQPEKVFQGVFLSDVQGFSAPVREFSNGRMGVGSYTVRPNPELVAMDRILLVEPKGAFYHFSLKKFGVFLGSFLFTESKRD
jgi:hypothetical protein